MVLSYTTSPAAHIMFDNNYDYSAINFEEGNYLSIEYAGVLKLREWGSPSCYYFLQDDAKTEFSEFGYSE